MIKKTYSFKKDGVSSDVYTLSNTNGVEVDILTYGARIIRISVPDRQGHFSDVIVGCKTPEDYLGANPYFGATIGRYGNRIGGAKFTLNGTTYHLEVNDKDNTLHGGTSSNFDCVVWNAQVKDNTLLLTHLSPDGAGGFPGNLSVTVAFTLTEDNAIVLDYKAISDKDTICNLTNHSYFNIGDSDTVFDQELMINSRKITPVDEQLIPHGDFMNIDDTPYSFLPKKKLGKDMFSDAKFIKACNGYDFNYCIERTSHGLEHFAFVYDKASGRRMDCFTTLPGVQLYTACGTGGFKGKKDYVNHCALCLETQCYPNSPNCPEYPTTLLKAGETYHETTIYKFSVE